LRTTTRRLGGKAIRALPATVGLCLLAGCASVQQVKTLVAGPSSPYLTGYIGEVVADEPRAALVGRDILARGGNAADAAAALGMSLAVTLPSRASLGAGGACLAFDAGGRSAPDAILFTPVAGPGGPDADRPASVPMLARGLFLLQARHGSVGFDELVRPAAGLARNGITVSRAFAEDLAQVREPLLADPRAREIFGASGDAVPVAGDRLVQPQLAETLDHIGQRGVADLYTGPLSVDFVSAANAAGGGLDGPSLRTAVPVSRRPLELDDGPVRIAFLPPPADGGLAAAAAFKGLQAASGSLIQLAGAAASAWRTAHPAQSNSANLVGEAQAALEAAPGAAGALGALPASTSFVVLDRSGNSVSCALSMDNLFGTGRVAGETGVVLGASPTRVPAPLLAAAIAWNRSAHSFRAAVAGSGQNEAAAAVAGGLADTLRNRTPPIRPATETGRINVISCPQGLPGDAGSCRGATDPRGAGLAIGSE
jgi:gamma-glutamyltranspeptidase / glutathione hydrolase